MTAAFLCGEADIAPSVIENQAAYLQGWINVLKGDKKLVIAAAGAAQRAADWILGTPPGGEATAATSESEPPSVAGVIAPSTEPAAQAFSSEVFALPA
jgi:antirestriction protein ArdC